MKHWLSRCKAKLVVRSRRISPTLTMTRNVSGTPRALAGQMMKSLNDPLIGQFVMFFVLIAVVTPYAFTALRRLEQEEVA